MEHLSFMGDGQVKRMPTVRDVSGLLPASRLVSADRASDSELDGLVSLVIVSAKPIDQ